MCGSTKQQNSESFDAVHSGKDTVSASLRFKQPGWSSTDMHNQVSKNIIERTAAEKKDSAAQRMNGILTKYLRLIFIQIKLNAVHVKKYVLPSIICNRATVFTQLLTKR